MARLEALGAEVLPAGVRARFGEGVNGLRVHLLEAGGRVARWSCCCTASQSSPTAGAACWRRWPTPGRGYGRTTGWDGAYVRDLAPYGILNLVRDAVSLVSALERRGAAMIAGHDFGASVAAACALVRPDLFRSVALMSAPFAGPPAPPSGTADRPSPPRPSPPRPSTGIEAALARLDPPRKHHHRYHSTPEAGADMARCRQGLHGFLRTYSHVKSADWPGNGPRPLAAWSAEEPARLPGYHVMPLRRTMPEAVAPEMPTAAQVAACRWLPDEALRVYSAEYGRTGFQGGLNRYRGRTSGLMAHELSTFSGRTIDVPAAFIAGARDWGVRQKPGDLEAMRTRACTRMERCELVEGAGHWVQRERPDAVSSLLLDVLHANRIAAAR